MRSHNLLTLAIIASVGLTGCSGGQPKGQVVAKVGKSEVTLIDLQGELNGYKAPDAKTRKIVEQQALGGILQRKILANAARKEKIDKSPEFARQKERQEETLLVRTWEARLVKAVPTPTPEEAQQFVNEHPDIYSARRLIAVDTIRFATPSDPTIAKALQPLNSLDEVRALLNERKIQFAAGATQIDAFATDPRLIEQLLKLKPSDIFVLPQNNIVIVGHITGTKVDPVPSATAVRHATEYLRQTRAREAVSRQFGAVLAAEKSKIKYSKEYEPAVQPSANKGTATSPKPATAAAAPKP